MTLEADRFGNVLKEVSIAYGRRSADTELSQADREKQIISLISYTENEMTNAIDDLTTYSHHFRTPLPCESRTYELSGYLPTGPTGCFVPPDFVEPDPGHPGRLRHIFSENKNYEEESGTGRERRLIEHVRTVYRKDDLTALLRIGMVEPLALPGENYRLALTPGLVSEFFKREGQPLLSNPAIVLGGQDADQGGYHNSKTLRNENLFPSDPTHPLWTQSDFDDHWWIPAGRVFFSPESAHTAAQERAYARHHFFLQHRYRDPFHTNLVNTESLITYDTYDLLMVETRTRWAIASQQACAPGTAASTLPVRETITVCCSLRKSWIPIATAQELPSTRWEWWWGPPSWENRAIAQAIRSMASALI